ncbi:MAG: hypothetical protein ACRC3Y_12825 [Romboutsia sp.]|uniref:hypothetical protein n=1 Tax=Romboutsia sp. TaxID=1965302 RepID=UPI003F37B6F2
MKKQIEIDYSFGYVYDKSKLVVMYPVGTNVMDLEEYDMEVEVAFLEDGIEVAFEENDIKEANEIMKPLQNFLMKPNKIIPFVTSMKDASTKENLAKMLKEFDEEYEVKESYIKKGYEIKDVYDVFQNVSNYIPVENLDNLNILKVKSEDFDMDNFIKNTKENLDEYIDSKDILVNMVKSSLTSRLFVKENNKNTNGRYVVFALSTGNSNGEIVCANKEKLNESESDLADIEISNLKDCGYLIEESEDYLTFKIANFNSQTENNRQIAQIVDYSGALKPMMINFINSFVK